MGVNDFEVIDVVIKRWVVSSVGSEHLPYKQGVTGSNPVPPTIKKSLADQLLTDLQGFFVFNN
jgi:hypothetical protein